MKTKFVILASAAMIAQLKAGDVRSGAVAHPGVVAHAGPAARAPTRSGGISSFHPLPTRGYSMPTHSFGGRSFYSGPRYSSFAMRSTGPGTFGQQSIYQNRVTVTRSGPYTAVSINQGNRFTRFANQGNPAVTNVWNQRNTGSNFRNRNTVWNGNNLRNANNVRNGNHRLRADWQKHVFARQSANWHRNWDRHSDHWWNGHRCSFVNGTWVIFNIGFVPWWYPDNYYGYGSPYSGYDIPYSSDYDPGYYNSGDYQGQMYYDQNSYPDQSQDYYDSMVYQNEVDSDQNADRVYSPDEIVVAAQERLALQGYYHGETDGTFNPAMQKAVRNYQITNGLRPSGYLDVDTLSVMGLQNPSY